MKTPGPQNPGVLTDDVESAERSLYLFFAAFFLAAGFFFAAFFLAAMLVLPPSLRTRTRCIQVVERVLMSQLISSARSSWVVVSVPATTSRITFEVLS